MSDLVYLYNPTTGQTRVSSIPSLAATYLVAASNSSAKSKSQADYVCDGTDDDIDINAALTALGAVGGTVLLSEGTFTISSTITVPTLCNLRGSGVGTIIQIVASKNANLNIVTFAAVDCVISDLTLNGNAGAQASGTQHCISISGAARRITIERCTISNCRNRGINIATPAGNNKIINNYFNGCRAAAIYADVGGNVIAWNQFNDNGYSTDLYCVIVFGGDHIIGNYFYGNVAGNYGGISVLPSGGLNMIGFNQMGSMSGNHIYLGQASGQNKLFGNSLHESLGAHIYLFQSVKNEIIGNVICGALLSTYGILLDASDNNTIIGNSLTSLGHHGLQLTGSKYNVVKGNAFRTCGQLTDNTYSDIRIEDNGSAVHSLYNVIAGNTMEAIAPTKVAYHVMEVDANQDYNLIQGNIGVTALTASFSKQGAHSDISHNISGA